MIDVRLLCGRIFPAQWLLKAGQLGTLTPARSTDLMVLC